jgi:hypothetical protein
VRHALGEFADAVDPEVDHEEVPVLKNGGLDGHESKSNSTAKNYLSAVRCAHQRGLDVLNADAGTVNDFMRDLVTEPERRRYDLVDYDGSMEKPSAKSYQSALRAFYRFCNDPGASADRPDVAVDWEAVTGSQDIIMFSERSDPKHDEADMPEQADLDAMREACLHSQNTRRDRAFLEVAAGTSQRVYALVTLKVKHVNLDDDIPHVLLNPKIAGDGDKDAIDTTGRWKPIVTDTGPIRQWIQNHPTSEPRRTRRARCSRRLRGVLPVRRLAPPAQYRPDRPLGHRIRTEHAGASEGKHRDNPRRQNRGHPGESPQLAALRLHQIPGPAD